MPIYFKICMGRIKFKTGLIPKDEWKQREEFNDKTNTFFFQHSLQLPLLLAKHPQCSTPRDHVRLTNWTLLGPTETDIAENNWVKMTHSIPTRRFPELVHDLLPLERWMLHLALVQPQNMSSAHCTSLCFGETAQSSPHMCYYSPFIRWLKKNTKFEWNPHSWNLLGLPYFFLLQSSWLNTMVHFEGSVTAPVWWLHLACLGQGFPEGWMVVIPFFFMYFLFAA